MALYKIVNNYYTDILNTINNAYINNNNDFNKAFDSIDPLYLMKKIAGIVVRLKRVQEADIRYWKSQGKTFKLYFMILLLILIIVFGGLIFWFFKFKKPEIKNDSNIPDNRKGFEYAKNLILYLIIFMVVFTLIFVILENLLWAIKRTKAQIEKNVDDFKKFRDLLLNNKNGAIVEKAYQYIGEVDRGHTSVANNILKTMETVISYIDPSNTLDSVDTTVSIKYIDTLKKINSLNINSIADFKLLLEDTRENLRNFYNDGNGYYELKKLVVSSSNVLTMREIKRVLNFYYFLSIKKSTDQNIEISDQNTQKLIKQVIIDPIINVSIHTLMSNQIEYLNLIDNISKKLVPYQIDLNKYSKFINDSIIKDTKNIDKNMTDFISELYKRLNKEIFIKQQTSLKNLMGSNNNNDSKFYNPDDFINNINDMVYADLIEGLEIVYLNDIITLFYNRITIAKDNKSMDDVFYSGTKIMNINYNFIMLFNGTLILGAIYYVVIWYQNFDIVRDANKNRLEELKTKGINEGSPEYIETDKANIHYATNAIIKLAIPLLLVFFLGSLVFSYVAKQRDILNYNKNMIEENTSSFMSSVNDVYTKIKKLDIKNPLTRIGDLQDVKDEDKFELFSLIKDMIDKFEKCNYIIEASKGKLPFPYAELSSDIFVILIIIIAILYLTTSFKPASKFVDMLKLKEQRHNIANGVIIADESMLEELQEDELCNLNDVNDIVFTIKVIFFIVIFIFLLYYSSQVLMSSYDFEGAVYNSSYYDQNKCYGKD
jgi:hypothetical protein